MRLDRVLAVRTQVKEKGRDLLHRGSFNASRRPGPAQIARLWDRPDMPR